METTVTIKTNTEETRNLVIGGMARVFASPFCRIAFAPDDEGAGGGSGEEGGDDEEGDDLDEAGDETDGGSELEAGKVKDADAKLIKENMRRKKQARELQGALKTAAADLEALKKRYEGIDPDLVKTLLEEKAERERQAAEAAGDFERVKEIMAEAHRKQLEAKEAETGELAGKISTLSSTVQKLTIDLKFSDSPYIRTELTLPPTKAQKLWADHFDVSDTGEVVAYDKPRGASGRTALVDSQNRALKFDDAIKHLVEKDADKDSLLKSKLKNGAGSKTADTDTTSKKPAGVFGASRITAALVAMKG